MTTVAPDTYTAETALGLTLLVSAVVVGLWMLSWMLLRTEQGHIWQWVALAATTGMWLTLAGGWLLTSAPMFVNLLPGDWTGYHRVIAELSEGVLGGAQPSRWGDRAVFFYVMALPSRALGSSGFLTVTVNAGMLGTSIVLLADLTRRFADARIAVTAAWLAAALPGLVVHSSLPLREALVLLLVVAIAWIGVRLATGPLQRPWEVVGLLGTTVVILSLAVFTRSEIVPILASSTALALGVRLWRWPPAHRIVTKPVGWVLSAAVATGLLLVVARPLHLWMHDFVMTAQVSFLNLHRGATSGIGPEPQIAPSAPLDLVGGAPLAVMRSLWGPPPGRLLTVQPLFVLDAAFLWVLTPFLVVGLWLALRRRLLVVAVLVVPALLWAFVTGMTVGNWGMVSRMRITTWALLLPLVAMGIVFLLERRFLARGRASDADRNEPSAVPARAADRPNRRGIALRVGPIQERLRLQGGRRWVAAALAVVLAGGVGAGSGLVLFGYPPVYLAPPGDDRMECSVDRERLQDDLAQQVQPLLDRAFPMTWEAQGASGGKPTAVERTRGRLTLQPGTALPHLSSVRCGHGLRAWGTPLRPTQREVWLAALRDSLDVVSLEASGAQALQFGNLISYRKQSHVRTARLAQRDAALERFRDATATESLDGPAVAQAQDAADAGRELLAAYAALTDAQDRLVALDRTGLSSDESSDEVVIRVPTPVVPLTLGALLGLLPSLIALTLIVFLRRGLPSRPHSRQWQLEPDGSRVGGGPSSV